MFVMKDVYSTRIEPLQTSLWRSPLPALLQGETGSNSDHL